MGIIGNDDAEYLGDIGDSEIPEVAFNADFSDDIGAALTSAGGGWVYDSGVATITVKDGNGSVSSTIPDVPLSGSGTLTFQTDVVSLNLWPPSTPEEVGDPDEIGYTWETSVVLNLKNQYTQDTTTASGGTSAAGGTAYLTWARVTAVSAVYDSLDAPNSKLRFRLDNTAKGNSKLATQMLYIPWTFEIVQAAGSSGSYSVPTGTLTLVHGAKPDAMKGTVGPGLGAILAATFTTTTDAAHSSTTKKDLYTITADENNPLYVDFEYSTEKPFGDFYSPCYWYGMTPNTVYFVRVKAARWLLMSDGSHPLSTPVYSGWQQCNP